MRIRQTTTTVFDGMIDELAAGDPSASGPSGAPTGVSLPNFILDYPKQMPSTPAPPETAGRSADARTYLEQQPAKDPSTDQHAIADELGLRPGLSMEEITLRRRSFALRNHPDRVSFALRELAHARMTIANALLDAEIAKLPKS
jgi:hypothetical protein